MIKILLVITIFIFFIFILNFTTNEIIENSLNLPNTKRKNKIPKIIWGYWNTGIQNAPQLVQKCIKNWKKYNPKWEIIILDDNNLSKYIDTSIFNNIIVKNSFVQKKSDLIRLLLLQKYGGIWMDSSIFLTQSLDWILKLQKQKNVDIICYYAEFFTANHKYPVIENWFIASTPNNQFINLWLEDFLLYLYNGYDKYFKTIKANNINTQKITSPKYLTMHISAQKIMQMHPYLVKNIYTIPTKEGPFKYHDKYDWDRNKAFKNILFQNFSHNVPKMIKMRGSDRNTVEKLLRSRALNKNSLFGKYVK